MPDVASVRAALVADLSKLAKTLRPARSAVAAAVADKAAMVRALDGVTPQWAQATYDRVVAAVDGPGDPDPLGPLPWRGHIGVRRVDGRPLSVNDAQVAARVHDPFGGVCSSLPYRLDSWFFSHWWPSSLRSKVSVGSDVYEFDVPHGLVILNVTFFEGARVVDGDLVGPLCTLGHFVTDSGFTVMPASELAASDPSGELLELTLVDPDVAPADGTG